MKRSTVNLLAVVSIMIWAGLMAGCAPQPTPYQPMDEEFGYEETRLQERLYRVSFKANRYTVETDVLDFLFLRSAELTKEAGFTHFLIQQDQGKTQGEPRSRSRASFGMGFYSGMRNSFWGAGVGAPIYADDSGYGIQYHLGVFIIRLLTADEAKEEKDALEVDYMLKSIKEKLSSRLPAESES